MAMDGAALGADIKTAIAAILDVQDETQLTNICNAIGQAVVDHITQNAQITGATGTGPAGGPLPIAIAPGGVT